MIQNSIYARSTACLTDRQDDLFVWEMVKLANDSLNRALNNIHARHLSLGRSIAELFL